MANQLLALLCSLRGSACIYQGEELGLPEAEVPFESLRDPYGITFWPNFKGRDGCRTPMPWNDAEHGGFSAATPWLPLATEHTALNVARQNADRRSTLNNFRAFLRWRREHPALVSGDIRFLEVPEPVVAFERNADGSTIFAAFNLSSRPIQLTLPQLQRKQIECIGLVEGTLEGSRLTLPAHGVVFAV